MVDLSTFTDGWQTSTVTRLSTGADEAQTVLDYLEADELAAELELIVAATYDATEGGRFVVRREPDEDGPAIYECDTLAELGAFLAGVSATVGRPTDD